MDPRELTNVEDLSKTVLTLAYEYSGTLSNIIGLIVALIIFFVTVFSNTLNIPLVTGYFTALIAGSLVSQGISALKRAKKAYSEETLKLHEELYSTNASYREMVSAIARILKHSAQTLISKERSGTLLLERKVYRYTVNARKNIIEYVRI